MALLGLAIGASLHFVPVVGLTLAIPIAIHWLSLLVNILTPALVGAAVVGAVAAASINFFGPAGHISRDETSTTDPILEEGVKRLLVQIVRALLLEHKIAAVDAPGTSPRLRPRSAAAAIGVAASGSLRGDELVDTGNFGEAGPPANPVAQELKFS